VSDGRIRLATKVGEVVVTTVAVVVVVFAVVVGGGGAGVVAVVVVVAAAAAGVVAGVVVTRVGLAECLVGVAEQTHSNVNNLERLILQQTRLTVVELVYTLVGSPLGSGNGSAPGT
jgi:O-antigen ligase